jgi:hypothetical protein
MADKTVAEVTFTNGVLAEANGGGPVEVFFVGNGDRLLSDILSDALAHCKRTKEYVHISMTLRFKTGAVVVEGPATSETVLEGMREQGVIR